MITFRNQGARAVSAAVWVGSVMAMPALVGAQIDYRTGHASNRVGSGGFNSRIGSQFVPTGSNLYVTGNVTGGRSFQAFSPVRDQYSLRVSTPTARLSDFRRDSVSLNDVLSGATPGTAMPYYSRDRVTTSPGTMAAGLDSYRIRGRDSYGVPRSTQPYGAVRPGSPIVPGVPQSQSLSPVTPGQLRQSTASLSPFLQPLDLFNRTYDRTYGETQALYGFQPESFAIPVDPRDQFSERLKAFADERAALNPFAIRPGDGVPESVEAPGDPLLQHRDLLTGRQLDPETEVAGIEVPTALPAITLPEPAAAPGAQPETASATALPGIALSFFEPTGADLYKDMLDATVFLEQAHERAAELETALATDPTLAEKYASSNAAAERVVEELKKSHAGTGATAVQNHIRAAEDLLRTGEYYRARAVYRQARVLDRRNPLVHLGEGYAMIAAGEYYSAAHQIGRGIEMFPEVALFKMDLNAFITEPDLLEKRRADLERRLERVEDYRYRFVLGYIEYFSGFETFGLANLRKAAENAPEGSGVVRFYEAVSAP